MPCLRTQCHLAHLDLFYDFLSDLDMGYVISRQSSRQSSQHVTVKCTVILYADACTQNRITTGTSTFLFPFYLLWIPTEGSLKATLRSYAGASTMYIYGMECGFHSGGELVYTCAKVRCVCVTMTSTRYTVEAGDNAPAGTFTFRNSEFPRCISADRFYHYQLVYLSVS